MPQTSASGCRKSNWFIPVHTDSSKPLSPESYLNRQHGVYPQDWRTAEVRCGREEALLNSRKRTLDAFADEKPDSKFVGHAAAFLHQPKQSRVRSPSNSNSPTGRYGDLKSEAPEYPVALHPRVHRSAVAGFLLVISRISACCAD